MSAQSRNSIEMTILDEIMHTKRREVTAARQKTPFENLQARLATAMPVRDFRSALATANEIRLIAEIKKASPSAHTLRRHFDPVEIALTYQKHGAACVSVLTDATYFQGCLDHLACVRRSVDVPLLRKDFLIDEYQVVEARLAGADAILLIAEILDDRSLFRLQERARELGMVALVEVHEAYNLPRVLSSGANLVGINNRDLRSFTTDIEHTLRLRDQIPPDVLVVSESGISTPQDIERLRSAGINAILVGEALMRSPNIGAAVDALLGKSSQD
jgi:indole-3-glycerol phosphate synthase